MLAEHVRPILTDPLQRPGPSFSVVSPRVWRFVDIARRLECLLAGVGWGTMPRHLVHDHLAAVAPVALPIDDPAALPGGIGPFAVHHRERPLLRGAQRLRGELQRRPWFAPDD